MTTKELKIFGKDIKIVTRNDGDWAIAYELFLDRQYKQCDKAITDAKSAIIDIGGHLGFFSLYAGLQNSNVPIFIFEPHEGNYELLKKNLKDNRIKNVTSNNTAVSKEVGQMELQISQEDLNHSITGALEPTGETQTVQTTTLERIIAKNRLKKVDLVKMDCEGSEYDILYNTPKEIFDKIDTLYIEYHEWQSPSELERRRNTGQNHMKLKSFLEKQGYKVQKTPNNRIEGIGFFWCTR